jgi:hypothetical protein
MTGTAETIVVPRRFNGPRESGNGGYTSGVLAARLDGPVEVNLRAPVPLDEPLELAAGEEDSRRLLHGETLIAEARSLPGLDVAVPEPVGLEEARRASSNYRASSDGPFSYCFVCGPARGEDCFEVFAGRVEGRELVATPWTPPAWAATADGAVRPEFVWAALDCPTYFACHLEGELTMSFLVRQRAELRAPVRAEEEHVVLAWPIETESRKRLAGAAVLSADGETLAVAEALLIEARPAG